MESVSFIKINIRKCVGRYLQLQSWQAPPIPTSLMAALIQLLRLSILIKVTKLARQLYKLKRTTLIC